MGRRLSTLAIAAAAMARDESSLVAASAVANLLVEISSDPSVSEDRRKALRPAATKLSDQVKQAAEDFSKIDLLSPVNLVGGGFFFRLVGPVVARSAGWRLLQNAWTATSGVSKATVLSVTGHAGVLASVTKMKEMSPAQDLADLSKAAAGRSQVAQLNIAPSKVQRVTDSMLARSASKSDALSVDSAQNLAEEIVFSKSDFSSAMKYAELFAIGERALPREEIRRLVQKGVTGRGYIQNRDDVIRRFDRYMVSRNLKVADADAVAVLRGYVDLYIGPHADDQVFAILAAMAPRGGGNCVARALNFTAFFYPAYLKYENPKLRFGIMNWTNHVEAVLYSPDSDAAMALYPMNVIDRQATSKGAPAVVDAKQFAAAFLYRAKSPILWEATTRHLKSFELSARSDFEIQKLNLGSRRSPFANRDLTSSSRDLDPNSNPFVTARYADAFTIPPGERSEMNVSARKRKLSQGESAWALKQLLRNEVSQAQVTAAGAKGARQVGRSAPGLEDVHSIYLSETEVGSVVGVRRVSPFGILFRSGMMQIPILWRDFSATQMPFKTPETFQDEIVRRVRNFQAHPNWVALVTGRTKTLEELAEDPSFTIALAEFSRLVSAAPGIQSRAWTYGKYDGEFLTELGNRFGAMAVDDEMSKATAVVDRILQPYVLDPSGSKLAEYLNSTSGANFGRQVRKHQALTSAMGLASDQTVKALKHQMDEFEFELLKTAPPKSAPDKAVSVSLVTSLPKKNLAQKNFAGASEPVARPKARLRWMFRRRFFTFTIIYLSCRTKMLASF